MEGKEVMKVTLSRWSKAVELHLSGRFIEVLECYSEIKDVSARMLYNQACAHIKLGSAEKAIESLSLAIEKDEHLAIAFFQRGTLHLQYNKSTLKAIADLEMTRTLLRGNTYIDYKPLGLYTRLSSFQILHNLALVYVNAKRLIDARNLLTEALHDADDLQRKSIQVSLQRIDDNRTDLIPVMQVSVDKVFTPPKSVTQNLEKRGIVRKAKVVAASNTDDRSAAFEGSKRVRELKLKPTPTEGPRNPLKRFAKNRPLGNWSASALNGLGSNNGMKLSKSMSDLLADDSSISAGSGSKKIDYKVLHLIVVRLKRLFMKRTSDSTDKQASLGIKLNRSSEDLNGKLSPPSAGTTGKCYPRHACMGVRKVLNNRQKHRSSGVTCSEEMPVLVMRASGSTGDLKNNDKCPNSSARGENFTLSLNAGSRTSNEKQNFCPRQRRNSLGSVFGDYQSLIGRCLSLSCDVLTAVVTPPELENNAFDVDPRDESADTDGKGSPIEKEKDNPVHCYTNNIPDGRAELEASKSSVSDKNGGDIAPSKTRKPRPPPPSYPPPPLPTNILIMV